MFTGLVVTRNGSAAEVSLTFSATKFTAFKPEAAAFKFNAEVWCPQEELNQRAEAVGNFIEQVHKRGSAKTLDLVFGPPQLTRGMKFHAGTCTVQLLVQESGDLAVSVHLRSVPPGANLGDRYDTCTINFDTHLADVQEFHTQLQFSSTHEDVAAVLRGFEAVT